MFTIDTENDKQIESIQENYNKFMAYVEQDSRAEQLKVLYKEFETELVSAPASGKVHFHNCFPGGYLDHVLRVIDTSLKMASLYKSCGGHIDFTKQELIFVAMNHDLGKLGLEGEPYYLPQDADWLKKRGELYKYNSNLQYFEAPERGLLLLQKYGIQITQNEWLGIKLSDGNYSEGNRKYLQGNGMKINLPYIIHWADHMSGQIEKDKNRVDFQF